MTASHTEPRNEFDFSPNRFRARQTQPTVELTGTDVWIALKTGVGMGFFIGIALGLLNLLVGKESGMDGEMNYFRIIFGCSILGVFLWVPLGLGCRATSRSNGILAGLFRLSAALFVTGYICSVLFIAGLTIYCKMNKPSPKTSYYHEPEVRIVGN